MKKADTEIASAIRALQNEIDSKALLLKALRNQYQSEEIDYYEYLKTEAWQEQRTKTFRRDGFRCVICGESKNLHCHHITYENLGAEELSDLVTLCENCHQHVHNGFEVNALIEERKALVKTAKQKLEVEEYQLRERNKKVELANVFGNEDFAKLIAYAILLGPDYRKLKEEERIGRYIDGAWMGRGLIEWLNTGKPLFEWDANRLSSAGIQLQDIPFLVLGEESSRLKKKKHQLFHRYFDLLGSMGYRVTSHFIDVSPKEVPDELLKMNELYKKLAYNMDHYKSDRVNELAPFDWQTELKNET